LRVAIALALAISPALADDLPIMGTGSGKAPAAAATGMKTIVPFAVGQTTGISTTVPSFFAPVPTGYSAGSNSTTDSAGREMVMPIAGKFTNLSWFRQGATAGQYIVSTRKNLAAGSQTCTEAAPSGSSANCTDASGFDNIAAGDLFGIKTDPNSTSPVGGTTTFYSSGVFTATNAGESFLLASTAGGNVVLTNFIGFQSVTPQNATESVVMSVMPAAGVIDRIYLQVTAAPGAAASAKSITATVFYEPPNANGSCPSGGSTSLTTTVLETATQNHSADGVGAITVAQGGCLAVQLTGANTPTLSAASVGVRFKPTNANEAVYMAKFTAGWSNSANLTRFITPVGYQSAGNSTENLAFMLMPAGGFTTSTARRLTSTVDVAAASGLTRAFNLRDAISNGAGGFTPGPFATPILCTQNGTPSGSDLASGCQSTTSSAATAGHFIDMSGVNSSTPPAASTTAAHGFVLVTQ
jgi:hypothetical protein